MREQETDSVLENEQSSELFVRNAFLVPKRTLTSDQRLKISHWIHVFLIVLLPVSAKLRHIGAISHKSNPSVWLLLVVVSFLNFTSLSDRLLPRKRMALIFLWWVLQWSEEKTDVQLVQVYFSTECYHVAKSTKSCAPCNVPELTRDLRRQTSPFRLNAKLTPKQFPFFQKESKTRDFVDNFTSFRFTRV